MTSSLSRLRLSVSHWAAGDSSAHCHLHTPHLDLIISIRRKLCNVKSRQGITLTLFADVV